MQEIRKSFITFIETYCFCNCFRLCSVTVCIASTSSWLATVTLVLLELGDESLELLVDLTWLIAGGLGAARFFILFGGVEALEDDDSDWPDTELTCGLVGLGGLSGGWSGCTITFGKKAEGWIRVFSKLILDRSTLAISSPFSRLPIFETLIRSCGRKSYLIHWTKVVFTLANRFHLEIN